MTFSFLSRVLHSTKRTAAQAQELIDAGHFDEADRLVDGGLLHHADDAALLEKHALSAHNSGRHATARDRWDRLREQRPAFVMA